MSQKPAKSLLARTAKRVLRSRSRRMMTATSEDVNADRTLRLLTFALTTLVEDAAGRGFLSANITRRPSAITESHCSTLLRTSLSGPSHRALRARPDYPSGRDCTAAQHTKRQSRRKRQIAAATGRPCCADRADSETSARAMGVMARGTFGYGRPVVSAAVHRLAPPNSPRPR